MFFGVLLEISMARTSGSVGASTIEFNQLHDSYIKKYGNPVEVLFKMMQSRKQQIKLQAAGKLLDRRYPKEALANMDLGEQGQLTLTWEPTTDEKPTELIDITPKAIAPC